MTGERPGRYRFEARVVDTNLQTLGLAAIVFIATGFIFLYLWVRVRRRRADLAREPIPTREVLEDRAYNQIHLARAAADRLERSGVDLGNVRSLLDKAEEARARGDPDTATAFARSAQETLARLRNSAPTRVPRMDAAPIPTEVAPSGPGPEASAGAWADTGSRALPASDPGAPESASKAADRIPKNKAESRFQLTLLDEEVQKAERSTPKARGTTGARRQLDDGRAAFDRGDYTEALRLGLRGRRTVGARLETLAPSRATQAEGDSDSDAPSAPPTASPAGPTSCANCGAPVKASDVFCRACGAPRISARCGQCGEALAGADRFCGACGAPIRD